jgi:hypothetical protein
MEATDIIRQGIETHGAMTGFHCFYGAKANIEIRVYGPLARTIAAT